MICLLLINNEFTQRILSAINSIILYMFITLARKDYEDRQPRQFENITKAKGSEKYKGRAINLKLHETIAALLVAGKNYTDIVNFLECSQSTISKIYKAIFKS